MSGQSGSINVESRVPSDSTKTFRWRVQSSHPVLQDHFPLNPLVPAFIQLEAIRQLVSAWSEVSAGDIRFRNVKFIAPLLPERDAEIVMQRAANPATLLFSLSVDGETLTRGEITVA